MTDLIDQVYAQAINKLFRQVGPQLSNEADLDILNSVTIPVWSQVKDGVRCHIVDQVRDLG